MSIKDDFGSNSLAREKPSQPDAGPAEILSANAKGL